MNWIDLQEADAPRIFECLRAVYQQPEYPLGGAWTEKLIESELSRGRGLAAVEEGALLCFALFRSQDSGFEISILATVPQARRRGLMSHLLTLLRGRLRAGQQLWLEVHEGNLAARKLYEKLGFKQVGRRKGYYRDGASALLYSLDG